jgi:crossover junction endodeoxyribonuclease RuvC
MGWVLFFLSSMKAAGMVWRLTKGRGKRAVVLRVLGLDPGLQHTGWGVIEVDSNRLRAVADGTVHSTASLSLAERLMQLHQGLQEVLAQWQPDEAAVEETFVNKNPASTLKLGQARGVVMLAPALLGIPVAEYQPTLIKKAVVGTGTASKDQVGMMIRTLLPGCQIATADAADALAVAICHAHHRASARSVAAAVASERARTVKTSRTSSRIRTGKGSL